MGSIRCVCGAERTADDEVLSHVGGVATIRCSSCELIRTSEMSDTYATLYTDGDQYHNDLQRAVGHEPYDHRFWHDHQVAAVSRVPKILEQLRSLDVGCANGGFVKAMLRRGFAAEGLEPNATMAAFAAAQCDAGKIHTSWETVEGMFDIITYHDVLEHIVDPWAELTRIWNLLRCSGMLVVDVPDAAEVFGDTARAQHHLRPEQHVFYYTEKTLRNLLESQFVVTKIDRPVVGKLVAYARLA